MIKGKSLKEHFNKEPSCRHQSPCPSHRVYAMLISTTTKVVDQQDNDNFMYIAKRVYRPGVTAAQLRLQPDLALMASVRKKISTVLLLVTMTGGRLLPQLLSIKVFPSPSLISTWSHVQLPQDQTSNWVNSSLNTFPISTCILSVLSTLAG